MEVTAEIAAQPKSATHAIVLFFTPTIFLSAFLLFWSEPMVGKMMLPLLGGAASVWITCLLFFQLMLLAGYGYAHALERYAGVRTQMLVHALLMLGATLFLPIHFTVRPDAFASAHPTLWLLGMLIRSVGVPFCIVSTTAPLLQNWLSKTSTASGRDPYFLYAVSNAGSLFALLAYPLWIEPKFGVHVQSSSWAISYGLLLVLVVIGSVLVWRHLNVGAVYDRPSLEGRKDLLKTGGHRPPLQSRLFWLGAAFVPSGLMLAVTNHMLLNLASVPFLWVMPLGIYLITFMIAFARRFRIPPRVLSVIVPIILLVFVPLVAVSRPVGSSKLWFVLGSHMLVLFASALLCHTALASRRPDTSQLTEFYFWVALGGALGGIFVAVIAPFVFSTVIEYPLLVALVAFFRETPSEKQELNWVDYVYPAFIALMVAGAWYVLKRAAVDVSSDLDGLATIATSIKDHDFLGLLAIFKNASFAIGAALALATLAAFRRRTRFAFALAVLLAGYRLALPGFLDDYQTLKLARDFFGIKKVVFDLDSNMRKLLHGDTLHGLESQDPTLSGKPLSYYHETGPVGDIMKLISVRPNQHVAVVGLGTGSMAGWGRPDRHITFFDIDPQVEDIARSFFTYLKRCDTNCNIVIGDGRLSIERSPDNSFDVLMLDAFNSDSIPAHLVSREAVQMYLHKLKPNGLILFHVSNRYMDVESLVSAVSLDVGLQGRVRYDDDEEPTGKTSSDYVVVARHMEDFGDLNSDENWTVVEKPKIQPWTDDYSNMMSIVRW
jgi:SAM-dependent methyltransferase